MSGTASSSSTQNSVDSMTEADLDNKPTREINDLGIGKKKIQQSNERCDPVMKAKEMAAITPDNVRGDTWRTPSSSMELKKICQKNARTIADESLINRVMDSLQKGQPLNNKFPPMMLASIATQLITLMANQPRLRENPSSQYWFMKHINLIMQQEAGLEGGIEQAMNLIESEIKTANEEQLENLERSSNNDIDDTTQFNIKTEALVEGMQLLNEEQATWWIIADEELDNSEQGNVSTDDTKTLVHDSIHGKNARNAVRDVCNKHKYNHESKSFTPRPQTPLQKFEEKERERNKG